MTIFSITYRFISKELFDRSLVKQGSAQNSQHFVCRPMQFKVMLYNSYHAISCDSGKYLDSYSTFSCPPEGLNLKMLLNPFKKEFHSPNDIYTRGQLAEQVFPSCWSGRQKFGSNQLHSRQLCEVFPDTSWQCCNLSVL